MRKNISRHFNKIVVDLSLEKNPPLLLTGKEAWDFILNNSDIYNGSLFERKPRGMFLYKDLNEDYFEKNNIDKKHLKSGVVCLVKPILGTLAHEMKHAKQLNEKSKFLSIIENDTYKYLYKKIYPYYPSEVEAFEYALKYLKDNRFKLKYFLYKLNYITLKFEYSFNYKMNKKLSDLHLS